MTTATKIGHELIRRHLTAGNKNNNDTIKGSSIDVTEPLTDLSVVVGQPSKRIYEGLKQREHGR